MGQGRGRPGRAGPGRARADRAAMAPALMNRVDRATVLGGKASYFSIFAVVRLRKFTKGFYLKLKPC